MEHIVKNYHTHLDVIVLKITLEMDVVSNLKNEKVWNIMRLVIHKMDNNN